MILGFFMSFFNRIDRVAGPSWHDYYSPHFIEATYKVKKIEPAANHTADSPSRKSSIIHSSRANSETQTSEIENNSQSKRKIDRSIQELSSKRICQESGTQTETDQQKPEKSSWTIHQLIALLRNAALQEDRSGKIHFGAIAGIVGGRTAKECEEKYNQIKSEELQRQLIDPAFKIGSEQYIQISNKPLSMNRCKQAYLLYASGIPLTQIAVILKRSLPACMAALNIRNEDLSARLPQTKLSPFLTLIFEKSGTRVHELSPTCPPIQPRPSSGLSNRASLSSVDNKHPSDEQMHDSRPGTVDLVSDA